MDKLPKHVVDIESLSNFTDSIGTHSEYLIQDFEGQLFHYTDLNALISIIKNHDLWLTNARYCNDNNEMIHGYSIAREVISEQRKKAADPETKSFLTKVAKLVDEPFDKDVYICCFCTKNNLLSQWRSYGKNGTGISIGFRPLDFSRYTGPDMPPSVFGLMRLWKVFYNIEVQKRIVEKALELIPMLHNADSNSKKAQKAADAIHFFIPTFKDKDFEEENERRLIFTPSEKCPVRPSFRITRGMLVPYYSLKELEKAVYNAGKRLPIAELTLGPGVHKELNVESAGMLLRENDYAEVAVGISETPYRG